MGRNVLIAALAAGLVFASCAPTAGPSLGSASPTTPVTTSSASASPQLSRADQLTQKLKVEKGVITVAVGGVNTIANLPYYVAGGLGYYAEIEKELGVTLKFQEFGSTPDALNALIARQADILFSVASDGVTASARKQDVVIVQSVLNSASIVLVARKESAITSPAELAGKTVGVAALGTGGHVQAAAIVRAYGVEAQKVAFVGLGGTTAFIPALTSGRVDVVAAGEPFASQLVEQGIGVRIADLYDKNEVQKVFSGGYVNQAIMTTRSFIDRNPGVVQAYVYETMRTIHWLAGHVNDPSAINATLPAAFEPYKSVLPNFYRRAIPSLSLDGIPALGAVQQVVKTQVDGKVIPNVESVNLSQLLEPSFAKAAYAALK